jgi:hypothetical protein
MTTPTIPPLPTQPTPTLDQQLAWLSLKFREAEFLQRVTLNADAERRNEAAVNAHNRLAAAQERAATAMERTLTQGIPTDQPMVDAINALRDAIAGSAASPAPPHAADEVALIALVSTMTSTQRQNPATAAAAAKAQLAAIRGQ